MTRGSSINFKKGSAGFEHNDRTEEHEAKHLLPIEHRLENECDRSATESRELLKEMVENAKEKYQERTGQKLQARIFAIEAAINLEVHHTLKDVEKINEYLEQKHGLRAVQSSIHRDEGHINDEGKPEYNLHAHVVYCNLDKDGKTVLKGLEKDDFRELQTFVAKTLNMQRGQSAEITKAKHKSPQEFRHEKVLATNKDLKAEIAQLREQFKEQGATRADYAQIEQLQKELKEQIKAKELSEDELHKRISELSQTVDTLQNDLKISRSELELSQKKQSELEISLKNLEEPIREPINASLIVQLQDENKILKISNKALESEVSALKQNRAAVEVQGDIEPLKVAKDDFEKWDTIVSNPDYSKKENFEDLEAFVKKDRDPKKVAIAVYNSHIVPDTGIMGKLGGEKKDTDLLIANMAKEIGRLQNMLKSSVEMLKSAEVTRSKLTNSLKTVVESTKTTLQAFFRPKERDLSSEVKKERTEPNLSNTDKIRGFIDQLKGNEPTKSRGLER